MKIRHIMPMLATAALLASCTSKRELAYFTNIDSAPVMAVGDYEQRIVPGDELIITVNSPVSPEATAVYNLPMANPATKGVLSEQSRPAIQQTYDVSKAGDIEFPVLGRLRVEGLTPDELAAMLAEKISADVADPVVKVEIASFYVNVAGEVTTPKRIKVTQNRYSVLDALTEAGDLTPYGKRENVLVIREENGQRTHMRLNLNTAEALSSPYFFVKQNDYIYVEPSDTRKENAEYDQNNSYRLSVISTVVSGASVIVSLIVAITK